MVEYGIILHDDDAGTPGIFINGYRAGDADTFTVARLRERGIEIISGTKYDLEPLGTDVDRNRDLRL